MRQELNEGFEHLRLAASHAADGAAVAIAPRVEAARDAAVNAAGTAAKSAIKPARKARASTMDGMDSLFDATRKQSRKASRKARRLAAAGKAKVSKKESARMANKRWSLVFGGLLAAGAVAGAATALVKRRRATRSWDEYATTRTTTDKKTVLDSAKNSMDAGVDRASEVAAAAKDRTTDLIG